MLFAFTRGVLPLSPPVAFCPGDWEGTPSPGALGRGVCSRALCCCFLSEQLPDTSVEPPDCCTAKQVCPLLRSYLFEGWALSSAFSCSAQHWGGRKGHGVPWKNAVAGLKIDFLRMTWEPTKPKEFEVCCYHLCNSSLNHWLWRRISLWLPWAGTGSASDSHPCTCDGG